MFIQPERNCQKKAISLPSELHALLPASPTVQQLIRQSRHTIREILLKKDPRLLLIVGPCSIHDIPSAVEYATRLKLLSQSLSDRFFIVMRAYFEKSRTAVGWKGFSNDPYLDGSYDIGSGLFLTRQLLLQLADIGLPVAAELLEPLSALYFEDLISWGCIGARTAESQIHRQMASGLDLPIAFKNSTSGNIEVAVHSIVAASQPHVYMSVNPHGILASIETKGNSDGHLVLRGGAKQPNYDAKSIAHAINCLKQRELPDRLLIDCSHDNSLRCHTNQHHVFKSALHQYMEGNKSIRGLILESHINDGQQSFSNNPSALKYAVSITDSCIGWESTEELLTWGYKILEPV